MRQSMRVGFVLLLLVGVFGVLQPAWGQEVTAAIVGTVTDPSGAPIKDADVTATDTERGTVRPAKTNDAGAYNITRLPVGTYSLKVTAPGFQTSAHQAFTLVLNQTARVDVQMKVGQVSETVEVTGDAPVLQTERAEVSTIIDSQTNDRLPLATRNYVQLTLLAPGAVSPNPANFNNGDNTANGARPYINGNREQAITLSWMAWTTTRCRTTCLALLQRRTPFRSSISSPRTRRPSSETSRGASSAPPSNRAPTVSTAT